MLRLLDLFLRGDGVWAGWSWRGWFGWMGGTKQMNIIVQRKSKSIDGIFGVLTLEWNPFTCVTLENLEKAIPAGVYQVDFNYSPHFNRIMPHILVPSRDAIAPGGDAGIRFHWANFPAQLEGCIALGTNVDGDSIDQSLIPFNQFYSILNQQHGITVDVRDIPV